MSSHVDYSTSMIVSKVRLAIDIVNSKYAGCNVSSLCELILAPVSLRGAVAKKQIKKNELTLVPVTTSISVTNEKIPKIPDAYLDSCNDFGSVKLGLAPKYPELTASLRAKRKSDDAPATNDKVQLTVPFWFVHITTKADSANMVFKIEHVMVCEDKLNVPLLVNARTIEPGERLLVLQPQGCSSKWPVYARPAKKARK